jgi:hypothetical protein
MPGEYVLFAVGLGDFNTMTNLSSVHTWFRSYSINKVNWLTFALCNLDYVNVVKGSESWLYGCRSRPVLHIQKCPCCGNFVNHVNNRTLYCPNCKKLFHRDVSGGQNIAQIAKTQLNEFCSPEYLTVPTAKHSLSSGLLKRNPPDKANEKAQPRKRKLTTRSQQTAPSQIWFEADATLIRWAVNSHQNIRVNDNFPRRKGISIGHAKLVAVIR